MSRGLKTTIVILIALVVAGLITLPGLRRAIQRMSISPKTEEEARREVMQVPISTATDVKVKAQIFWLSASSTGSLEATTVEIPLSADPVERSKQLLNALIIHRPSSYSWCVRTARTFTSWRSYRIRATNRHRPRGIRTRGPVRPAKEERGVGFILEASVAPLP